MTGRTHMGSWRLNSESTSTLHRTRAKVLPGAGEILPMAEQRANDYPRTSRGLSDDLSFTQASSDKLNPTRLLLCMPTYTRSVHMTQAVSGSKLCVAIPVGGRVSWGLATMFAKHLDPRISLSLSFARGPRLAPCHWPGRQSLGLHFFLWRWSSPLVGEVECISWLENIECNAITVWIRVMRRNASTINSMFFEALRIFISSGYFWSHRHQLWTVL